jgi:hypothetical protein
MPVWENNSTQQHQAPFNASCAHQPGSNSQSLTHTSSGLQLLLLPCAPGALAVQLGACLLQLRQRRCQLVADLLQLFSSCGMLRLKLC